MESLLTLTAFVAITALAVWIHLGRARARTDADGRADARRSCPRCDASIPAATPTCPSCRAPLQAYEIVTASPAPDNEPSGGNGSGARLHAVLRADVCVGCGACVDACAGPRAIHLVNKRAVVDLNACVGLGHCAEACPVGALVLSTGESVQRIEVPDLDVHFQSSVPGLYVVGELGGRGLIKNAVNEGKLAVEHIARELRRERGPAAAGADTLDVLIVGTGPAGLSAGLEAQRAGLSYLVLERGTVADTIRKYPRHKLLMAEPVKVPLYGDLWLADASKESLLKVWESIISTSGLDVLTHHEVVGLRRGDDLFLVEAAGREFRARRVVLALGRRGRPRRLGVPGEDLAKTIYDVVEMETFAGRRVLVVGGGDSAVESAVGLSRQPGTDVALSYRGDRFKRVKDRNRTKLDEAVREGRMRVLLCSQVLEIRDECVLLDVDGASTTLPNDDVVVRIGGEPPYEFLKRVGVRITKKDVPIPGGGEARA